MIIDYKDITLEQAEKLKDATCDGDSKTIIIKE